MIFGYYTGTLVPETRGNEMGYITLYAISRKVTIFMKSYKNILKPSHLRNKNSNY